MAYGVVVPIVGEFAEHPEDSREPFVLVGEVSFPIAHRLSVGVPHCGRTGARVRAGRARWGREGLGERDMDMPLRGARGVTAGALRDVGDPETVERVEQAAPV